jgi:hypothetical protein
MRTPSVPYLTPEPSHEQLKTVGVANQTRFGSASKLESTLRNYLKIYNNNIPQRALKHQTQIQALKKWQQEKPELFVKRVYNQAGLDTCTSAPADSHSNSDRAAIARSRKP